MIITSCCLFLCFSLFMRFSSLSILLIYIGATLSLLSVVPAGATTADSVRTLSSFLRGEIESSVTVGRGTNVPFWLGSNQDGVASIHDYGEQLKWRLERPLSVDSGRRWHTSFGFSGAVGAGLPDHWITTALYGMLEYGRSRLTVGIRPHETPLNNTELSTGSFVLGRNAAPPFLISWSVPRWWKIGGRNSAVALCGHLGYGFQRDGGWQARHMGTEGRYATRVSYHEKSGYVRLGRDSSTWLFMAGAEMATQFGGAIHNLEAPGSIMHLRRRLPEFFYALIAKGGSDPTDGEGYANASGNTVGAWRASLSFRPHRARWAARLYYDHFFEDESAAFDEYGWLDGLVGVEVHLPLSFIRTVVVEAVKTDYQSGSVYHDHTPELKDQVSAVDNYYNHGLYPGWQHFGMANGNALFVSPLYAGAHSLTFFANRFRAFHLGFSGRFFHVWDYRFLCSFLRSWGTYAHPFSEVQHLRSVLFEVHRRIPSFRGDHFGHGWRLTGAFACDGGDLLGHNLAVRVGLAYCL